MKFVFLAWKPLIFLSCKIVSKTFVFTISFKPSIWNKYKPLWRCIVFCHSLFLVIDNFQKNIRSDVIVYLWNCSVQVYANLLKAPVWTSVLCVNYLLYLFFLKSEWWCTSYKNVFECTSLLIYQTNFSDENVKCWSRSTFYVRDSFAIAELIDHIVELMPEMLF